MNVRMYLIALLVGGGICALAQLVLDFTKLTPGHLLTGMTVLGGVLGGLGLYKPFVKFAGAGATMPISSFGNALVQGAIGEARSQGVIGVLTGMFELTSTGITAAIVFGFLVAVLFNPKD